MKTFSIGDEYFSLTLNERRERFLNLSPAFSVLEQRVLAHGGNRLIYMPEMIHVDELIARGELISEAPLMGLLEEIHRGSHSERRLLRVRAYRRGVGSFR